MRCHAKQLCGDRLIVDCGRGHLRIFTENGRSSDRAHATFARALASSLLNGFLVSRGFVPIGIFWLLSLRVGLPASLRDKCHRSCPTAAAAGRGKGIVCVRVLVLLMRAELSARQTEVDPKGATAGAAS